VNKDNFIKVLHHYSVSSTQEAEDVLLLKKDYPYSQVLHTLSARVSKDHGFSSQQIELQLAAIYAADRTVLKEIMTFEEMEEDDDTTGFQPAEAPVQRFFTPAPPSSQDDLANEIISDLERLHQLKHNFEMMFVEAPVDAPAVTVIPAIHTHHHDAPESTTPAVIVSEVVTPENIAPEVLVPEVVTPEAVAPEVIEPEVVIVTPEPVIPEVVVPAKPVEPAAADVKPPSRIIPMTPPAAPKVKTEANPKDKEQTKSRKERIIELARARNPVTEEPAATTPQTTPAANANVETPRIKARPPRRRKEEGDSLLDEITNSKAELTPENDKLKNQIDLIDQFIKSQPSFANKEKPTQPSSDLTAIKTGEFADSIVSETLVEILIKQGKKDKAIEVLKKLIWKFPQKKAYFAAQIEELKK